MTTKEKVIKCELVYILSMNILPRLLVTLELKTYLGSIE